MEMKTQICFFQDIYRILQIYFCPMYHVLI